MGVQHHRLETTQSVLSLCLPLSSLSQCRRSGRPPPVGTPNGRDALEVSLGNPHAPTQGRGRVSRRRADGMRCPCTPMGDVRKWSRGSVPDDFIYTAWPPLAAWPGSLRSLPLWHELLCYALPAPPGVEKSAPARDGGAAGLGGESTAVPTCDRA